MSLSTSSPPKGFADEGVELRLSYTPDQEALQREFRAYFASIMTPEERIALRKGYSVPEAVEAYRAVVKRLGRDGWLGIGWPVEMGGLGKSMIEQAIFNDESTRARVPTPLLTINSVGPTLFEHGSDRQREEIVGGILSGDLHFAIGYSEPSAGTDLASLTTRAVRDGDEYVINGQKLWTGLMEAADYLWLAVRTDPDAPKHRGISIFLVPRHAPGITSVRMRTMGDQSVATVTFDDVRVPLEACVGGENNGWRLITGQLNFERVALNSSAYMETTLRTLVEYCRTTPAPGGGTLADRSWVRERLALIDAKVHYLTLLNHKLAGDVDRGVLTPADASAVKVYGSETSQDVNEIALEILGLEGLIEMDSPGAVLGGNAEHLFRAGPVQTFIGGTNEVQRDLISQLGLGLPRGKR